MKSNKRKKYKNKADLHSITKPNKLISHVFAQEHFEFHECERGSF